ncbi:MAG: methyltransferase domain-containing protein [Nitrososphaera sp.]
MLLADTIEVFPRVVVELGMGDGRLLESLARYDSRALHVGIEIDDEQCRQASSWIRLSNVLVLNGAFEEVLQQFPDASVDTFLAVLPGPPYIEETEADRWRPLYKLAHKKLKSRGAFRLITELTDELLQPVSDSQYSAWTERLRAEFISLGFVVSGWREGAPPEYSSRCLDQFRGDPQRIRLVTFDLVKP